MFWTVTILGSVATLALLAWGGLLLTRAQRSGTGTAMPIFILVLGCVALLGTVVGAILTKAEQPVGSTQHQVEIVSRSARTKPFYLTLRKVESGEVYANIRLRGGNSGTGERCRNGLRNFTPGRRFAAPFTVWRNSDTGVRTEAPDEAALGRIYC